MKAVTSVLAAVMVTFGLVASAAQALEDLAGDWAVDRAASTPGQGDPGAEFLTFRFTSGEVHITRTFGGSESPAVWVLPLDGSPQAPSRGTAGIVNGQLVATFTRSSEIVVIRYAVSGGRLRVERSITGRAPANATSSVTHVMFYDRID